MNRNPADIGGEAAGPIDTVDHGMKFWEKQANALRNTLTSRKVIRRAICGTEAPLMAACSSSAGSMERNAAVISRNAMGE